MLPAMARRAAAALTPPDESALQAAALDHLARFAATEAGLRRVLERRVARWARAAEAAGVAEVAVQAQQARRFAAAIAARLAAAGAVNDADFAAARASRLVRSGRSQRAIAAHLAAKGVDAETARAALEAGEGGDLAAALALARRRRLGPFAAAPGGDEATPDEEEGSRRALAILARAGFGQETARRALAMERDAAEALLLRLRHG